MGGPRRDLEDDGDAEDPGGDGCAGAGGVRGARVGGGREPVQCAYVVEEAFVATEEEGG